MLFRPAQWLGGPMTSGAAFANHWVALKRLFCCAPRAGFPWRRHMAPSLKPLGEQVLVITGATSGIG
jgi:hypothetical protein